LTTVHANIAIDKIILDDSTMLAQMTQRLTTKAEELAERSGVTAEDKRGLELAVDLLALAQRQFQHVADRNAMNN
jgi:hypothetical protein